MTINLLTGLHAREAALLESGFVEMHHPPYSPHLASSLFPYLKEHLCGLRFLTVDELKYATEEWLKEHPELFYFTGIEKVRDCY